MFFSKKNSILGVDIGTSNIKIVQVTHEEKPVLDTYGIVNTSYQIGAKNEALATQQMAGILRSLVQRAGVTAKRCVISFPNSAVFSSVVQLPRNGRRNWLRQWNLKLKSMCHWLFRK